MQSGMLLCPRRRGGALSDTAIRPSVCPSLGYRHAGWPATRDVRTADLSANGRRSAASRTAIGGGHIVSPPPPWAITCQLTLDQCDLRRSCRHVPVFMLQANASFSQPVTVKRSTVTTSSQYSSPRDKPPLPTLRRYLVQAVLFLIHRVK